MNRGYYEVNGRTNTGLFLRRGRIPAPHDLLAMRHMGNAIGGYGLGGVTPSSLTTAYSFGVSGTVRALRFMVNRTRTITEIWYATGAKTGSPVGALTIELRGANASNALLPGTLLTSETNTPASDAWNRVVLTTPQQLSPNTLYYVIVGDPAGNATNYYRVYDNTGGLTATLGGAEARFWAPINTTNGFTTAGTLVNGGMCMLLKYADGGWDGMQGSGGGTPASNTLKRGMYLSDFETDMEIYGMSVGSAASWNGVEIFGGDQAPNSTPLYRQTVTTDARNLLVCYLERPFRMRVGNTYRVVMTFSANSSSPGQNGVANPSTSPNDTGMPWGKRLQPTIATSGNAWQTGYKVLGISHYSIVLLVNRVLDPRV